MWNDMINEASKERRETVTAFKVLSIDIETYSSNDISGCGVYKYAEAEDFTILLFAYSCDYGPVEIIDLASGEKLPDHIYKALSDPKILKTAFNATFERICLSKYFGLYLTSDQWECTMVRSAMLGLPLSLAAVGKVLNLEDQKMDEGKALIRYFSVPCKPTKTNGMRTRNLPEHAPDKWDVFKKYCKRDVEVENAIRQKTAAFRILPAEKELYDIDQRINDRGVMLDMQMVNNAIRMSLIYSGRLTAEAAELTGLDNPNSVAQLKGWLEQETGNEVKSLNKKDMPDIIKSADAEHVQRLLSIRQELGKTSVKKYEAMSKAVCEDDRARGLTQFYGASRTGRWCLTGDHEVLTPQGWIRLDEWGGGVICCWNASTEILSFQKADPVSFDYSGIMYHINCQRCDQLSTPEHKMPYWTDSGWKHDEIQKLTKRFRMPFTGVMHQLNNYLDHTELRILVMTQADGHYTVSGDLRYHFSKLRKIERCKGLLRKAGLPHITKVRSDGTTTLVIKKRDLPLYLRLFSDKVFGTWILSENADVIFDELEHWDAYRCGPNSIQYSSTVKQNVDMIQALAALSGRSCTVVTKNRDNENPDWNTAYTANIWLTPGKHTEIRREFVSKENFSGKVYCAVTETGFFLVRRNGKVWITGNSGRLIQLQNLPQNHIEDLDFARSLVFRGDLDMLELCYGNVPDTLSQLIRTAIIAKPGHTFIVSDFSAIEARVIAWLAGEAWRLEVFRTHGKIYEASASMMFHVPVESITKTDPRRQKGKIAELALGYQGGVGAMKTMGGEKMGLSEDEMKEIVTHWRSANPAIVGLWDEVQAAAMQAISGRDASIRKGVKFRTELGALTIELPSGRKLFYPRARIESREKFGRKSKTIIYEGQNQTTKKWEDLETYGGKLVENIVQGIARDCLAVTMVRLEKMAYPIVFHVHDEVILEVPDDGTRTLAEVCEVFKKPIVWVEGLPLKGDGYVTNYYKKD